MTKSVSVSVENRNEFLFKGMSKNIVLPHFYLRCIDVYNREKCTNVFIHDFCIVKERHQTQGSFELLQSVVCFVQILLCILNMNLN